MSKRRKNKKTVVFSVIILLLFGIVFGIVFASHNSNKAMMAENMKNNDKKIEQPTKTEVKNKKDKITKEQAEKIVRGEVKKKENKLSYINIAKVPYDYIETPYKEFPKEILNKEVYIFELSELVDKKNNESITLCRYYVDFNGGLYKDTYFINLECVKLK